MTLSQRFRPLISIHALREEGDSVRMAGGLPIGYFYPRPPRGGRPAATISIHALREEGDTYCSLTLKKLRYFYPRPPRGGRRHGIVTACIADDISIHALREEGDIPAFRYILPLSISIHALREEGDLALYELLKLLSNFYPRPPRGGRPFLHQTGLQLVVISIHALLEEGDAVWTA